MTTETQLMKPIHEGKMAHNHPSWVRVSRQPGLNSNTLMFISA